MKEILLNQGARLAVPVLRWILERRRFMGCRLVKPNGQMRIAFSAILRLSEGDEYILVRNLHRRETFGPFGGVYKHLDMGLARLDALEFRPQTIDPKEDSLRDLRGFLPRKSLPGLVTWFRDGKEREGANDCLRRELSEELEEIGFTIPKGLRRQVQSAQFSYIRTVTEGPERVAGHDYTQYRIFDVFALEPAATKIFRMIRDQQNEHLLIASSQEIIEGRSANGFMIGNHTCYLISRKRMRPEAPIFSFASHR